MLNINIALKPCEQMYLSSTVPALIKKFKKPSKGTQMKQFYMLISVVIQTIEVMIYQPGHTTFFSVHLTHCLLLDCFAQIVTHVLDLNSACFLTSFLSK
jgi:hypothetical protein